MQWVAIVKIIAIIKVSIKYLANNGERDYRLFKSHNIHSDVDFIIVITYYNVHLVLFVS